MWSRNQDRCIVSPMHGIAEVESPTSEIPADQIAYTVKQAAAQLAISERYMWHLVKVGEDKPGSGVPSVKIGGARRILRSDLAAFAESRRAA